MTKDQVSALMDGELGDDEARIVFGRLKQDAAARDEWQIYHLIGDSLRQTPVWDNGFPARFSDKLATEPTVLAPRRHTAFKRPVVALSAAASLAAVSLVAWTAFQLNQPDSAPPTSAGKIASSEVPQNVNRYLAAHQEYSAAAIPGASPYLKASLERQQGRK